MLLLFVCVVVHPMLYVVPNQGSRWPRPALVETTSLLVATGNRKLDGGSSWLLEFKLVRMVGLNTPYAAATLASLICGSRRSTLRSTLSSSAIRTASSTVSFSVCGACAVIGGCAAPEGAVCADAVAASASAATRTI